MDPGNPYFPLPADYPQLSKAGQKAARLAALSDQSTSMKFVAAWALFRRLYLEPTEPGFFYHNYQPSPPFHYQMVYDMAEYSRNVQAAPRGFSKSVIIATELPLFLLLTRKHFRIIPCLSTDREVEGRFETIITQLTSNPYILEDFGNQKPNRGSGIWNRHYIHLLNGSVMSGYSVMGKKRGARPDLFLLDDPEFDPDNQVAGDTLRAKFEVILFKQVIPMLESGSAIFWIGTIIGSRSFLHHAIYNTEDKRFDCWNRRNWAAQVKDPQGEDQCLWDAKWGKEVLEVRRMEIGESSFHSEYLGTPGSSEERLFKIDPQLDEYTLEEGTSLGNDPLTSTTIVKCHRLDRKTRQIVEEKTQAGELFKHMYRVLTFDPARGMSAHHDYSCIPVIGFDRYNCLWVLDMWMGRATEAELMNRIWNMGFKWDVKLLGIESVSMQVTLLERIRAVIEERAVESDGWNPYIVPVDYEGVRKDKAGRISTLEWRFPMGLIKYPGHLKNQWPWTHLYSQTQDFTYDLALLPHDDAIDSVAMAHYITHGKGIKVQRAQDKEKTITNPADELKRGNTHIGGIPLIQALGSGGVTTEIITTMLDRRYGAGYSENYTDYQPKRTNRMTIRNRYGTR